MIVNERTGGHHDLPSGVTVDFDAVLKITTCPASIGGPAEHSVDVASLTINAAWDADGESVDVTDEMHGELVCELEH